MGEPGFARFFERHLYQQASVLFGQAVQYSAIASVRGRVCLDIRGELCFDSDLHQIWIIVGPVG